MYLARRIHRNFKEAATFGVFFPLRHLAKLAKRPVFIASAPGVGRIQVRPDKSDASTFYHVFVAKAYDIRPCPHYKGLIAQYQDLLARGKRPLIIDAGSNVGAAALWFAKEFPEASILAVEPDPENVKVCRKNTQAHPNISVFEAAIGCSSGHVQLQAGRQLRADCIRTIRTNSDSAVPVISVEYLMKESGPNAELFIVKIDIEGFESDLFSANLEWLDQVSVVMIEPHDWLFPRCHTSLNFRKAFASAGFEIIISDDTLFYLK